MEFKTILWLLAAGLVTGAILKFAVSFPFWTAFLIIGCVIVASRMKSSGE